MRPLASDLGVSPRTLLYHFGSKENLIVEAIRHLRRRQPAIRKMLEDPPTASTTASETISEAIGRLWDEAKQPQSQPFLALYFELAALSVREPATYRTLVRTLDDDWVHTMRGQLASWDVHPQRMESVISTALAGYRGALLLALTTADWTAADEAITTIIEALTQQISQEEREPS